MRKIEARMSQAIQNGENWKSANTSVASSDGMSDVFLHGNHIARVLMTGRVVVNAKTLSNYPTRTTMSRLRALGVDVYTRKGAVMLDGQEV